MEAVKESYLWMIIPLGCSLRFVAVVKEFVAEPYNPLGCSMHYFY
ncbi:MAG: hypothetical protein JWP12_87 [Bacteroidetes bacterium]|nr:hypothetical protein [Bacteroidota bacterium]